MNRTTQTVLGGIGKTPLAELRKVVPPGSTRIVAKPEWANPNGSMKDRMARAAMEQAGRFVPDRHAQQPVTAEFSLSPPG